MIRLLKIRLLGITRILYLVWATDCIGLLASSILLGIVGTHYVDNS